MDDKVDLLAKAALLDGPFRPGIVGYLNEMKLAVARIEGEFVWHAHEDTDDFFLCLEGEVVIGLREREVTLGPGECFVVPRGAEHRPRSDAGATVLLIEPRGTVNTGDAGDGALTAPEREL